jgi:hypothetical protein
MGKFINKGKDEFLKELSIKQPEIFNNYDWSEFNYITNKTKSKVIDYYGLITYNSPKELILGRKPSIETAENKTFYFINLLKRKHNWVDDYDWSNFVYINRKTKSTLSDNLGNIYLLSPESLINNKPNNFSLINRELVLIESLKNKFPKYDFSKFIYNGVHNKSIVICSEHGEFLQSPHSFNKGHCCPFCTLHLKIGNYESQSKINPDSIIYLYNINLYSEDENFYKIGLTKNLNQRMNQFSKYKVKIIETIKGTIKELNNMEKELKKFIYNYNINYSPKIPFPGKHECYKW